MVTARRRSRLRASIQIELTKYFCQGVTARSAAQAGPGVQNKVVTLLFRAFFEEGKDIGSAPVLIDIARQSGMDISIGETLLPTDAEQAGVIGEIAKFKQMGITGVPCFIIDQKYVVSGA
jgi:predicted DsbA family dithiol-disulfide isomerase